MKYIIGNADILRGSKLSSFTIITDGKELTDIRQESGSYTYLKMDMFGFIMTPTYTILDGTLAKNACKETIYGAVEKHLLKGCTTLVTFADVSYENDLPKRLDEVEEQLRDSPADYVIAVKIPLKSLTPSLIRECRKRKLPAVFVEIKTADSLEDVPWGWMREAMFPRSCPLVPIASSGIQGEDRLIAGNWKRIMLNEKINSLHTPLEELKPVSIFALNKMGIYPARSSLMHKAELSYNLYINSPQVKNVDEDAMFLYHGDRLAVTVHKGKVVRAGQETDFSKGYGEYVKIKTHSFFSL